MIVGITGTLGAGKGNIVEALVNRDFNHFSVREFLSEEVKSRGLEVSRDSLVNVANDLRNKHGAAYLVEQLHKRASESGGNAVIESLRNPGEVDYLRFRDEFYLVAVDAPQQVRYERVVERGSATDAVSFEEFAQHERREMSSSDPNSQKIGKCMLMADYIFNSGGFSRLESRQEFESGKGGFLNLFGEKPRVPSFDELFMRQAYEWSERTKCLRRSTGAVITDGKIFVSQGYNGPPRGVKHCSERGGCVRANKDIPSGERLELCYAAHSEANAIWNANRTGRSVMGTTMYTTTYPCKDCSIAIIQSGIERVIYLGGYPSELSETILNEADVVVEQFSGVVPRSYPKFWG